MDSWPAPVVPRVSGQPEPLRVFDTSSQQLRVAAAGPSARLYVCGITPYDATHIGHAATFLAFDLMHRFWQDAGLDVRYVQNVTDVDDPLLERATATGQDWSELARAETALFRQDMTALQILPPAEFVGAVESIPKVVNLITELLRKGAAYYVDKDVYFSVGSDEDFGGVTSLDRDTMLQVFGERGGDPDRSGKKDPLDCLLWQAQRPSEPAWDTDLGHGRPGWHIECAAIALDRLGMSIDVQGGGSDLAFPHHEMSASEAQVAMAARPFARTYVHAGMVGLDGTKMSKSKGNLVFVSRLLDDGHDPMAIRLALLAHHYRSDWEWADKDLEQATRRLHLWHTAVTAESGPDASPVINEVRACLAADLDAPSALRILDRWADDAAGASKHNDRAAPRGVADLVDALLGVDLGDRS